MRPPLAPRLDCPGCGERLHRCDAEVLDPARMPAHERDAWLRGDFGLFQCDACGEFLQLLDVPPPAVRHPAAAPAMPDVAHWKGLAEA